MDKRRRFEQMVLPHFDAAYNLARWLARSGADADDVVQEAFLKAFQSFDNHRGGADARPWLFAIVRNCCYTMLRKNKQWVPLDESAQAHEDPILASAAIEDALRALPPEFREVIVLREMEDFSYKEIAEVTGVPIGTVMSRLSRARRQLQEHVNK